MVVKEMKVAKLVVTIKEMVLLILVAEVEVVELERLVMVQMVELL